MGGLLGELGVSEGHKDAWAVGNRGMLRKW